MKILHVTKKGKVGAPKKKIDILINKTSYSLIKGMVFHLHLMDDTYGVYIRIQCKIAKF
jgi:hypothetical protein